MLGRPARGDWPGSRRPSSPPAAVLLSPFVPLLFMGEEYGETAPFPYFTSHADPELVEAVRRGRAQEFAAFALHGRAARPAGRGDLPPLDAALGGARRPACTGSCSPSTASCCGCAASSRRCASLDPRRRRDRPQRRPGGRVGAARVPARRGGAARASTSAPRRTGSPSRSPASGGRCSTRPTPASAGPGAGGLEAGRLSVAPTVVRPARGRRRCLACASGRGRRTRWARPGTARARTSRSSPSTRPASSSACSTRADAAEEAHRIELVERTDLIWHAYLPDVRPGQLYGYRVHGPYDAGAGPPLQPAEAPARPLREGRHRPAALGRHALRLHGRPSRRRPLARHRARAPAACPSAPSSTPPSPGATTAAPRCRGTARSSTSATSAA